MRSNPSVPRLKQPVPAAPAAAVVSEAAGAGALMSRWGRPPNDPEQRRRGWASSVTEIGHVIPMAEITANYCFYY